MAISEDVKLFIGDLSEMPIDTDSEGRISTSLRLHASSWLEEPNTPWTEHMAVKWDPAGLERYPAGV